MRYFIVMGALLGLTGFMGPSPVLAGEQAGMSPAELDRAIEKAVADLEELRESSREQRALIAREREDLFARIGASEGGIDRLKEESRSAEEAVLSLRAEIDDLGAGLNRLDGLEKSCMRRLRSAAEELALRLKATLVGLQHPDLVAGAADLGERLKGDESDPARALEALVDLVLDEIRAGSRAGWFEAEVVDQNGAVVKARIFRVGEIAALCVLPDGKKGLLVRSEDGEHWRAVVPKAGLSGHLGVPAFFRALRDPGEETAAVPIDVSGGLALSGIELGRSLRETFRAGGFIMWPLALVALGGILITLERACSLARVHLRSRRIMPRVEAALETGGFEEAEEICRRKPGPVGRVLLAGLNHRQSPKNILEDVLQESILHETPRLERFLSTLGVLAMIAPLLGLLGTVTGMIATFRMISAHGSGDPRLLSGGISEALITTQAGLVIAVPLLLTHAYYSERVNHIFEHIEANATRLVTLLVSRKDSGGGARPNPESKEKSGGGISG